MIYVISKEGKPLMPTKRRGKVRHLLKDGKAIIVKYEPFTIQLLYETTDYKQKIILGVDPGSKNLALTAITEKGNILYHAEVTLRTDIKENIRKKRTLRKARRQRKTPYRKARFLNRKKPSRWLPPSIRAKLHTHYQMVKSVASILPVTMIILEVGQFDTQAIINPDIEGTEYQNGQMTGFDSVKEFVKLRDKFTCHYKELRPDIICNDILVVDHIIPQSKGGTSRPDNLITSCEAHNIKKSNLSYKEFTGKKRPVPLSLKETPFMNILKDYLFMELQKIAPSRYTFGLYTRRKRKEFFLEKSHLNDSIAITGIKPVEMPHWDVSTIYHIKQVRKKKRSLHEEIPRKGRSKPNRTAKRNRKNIKSIEQKGVKWSLWDKVYIPQLQKTGFISGFTDRWAYIQGLDGSYLQLSRKYRQNNPKKIRLISRNNNYIYMEEKSNHRKESSFISL
ncbi:MAG: RNA-guided endonuclease IscB [Candidatus Eremiobacterota bacterium]